MKKVIIIIPALLALILSGCLKDKPNNDFSNLSYVAEITTASVNSTPNAPSSGLAFFGGATLSFATAPDLDTVSFTVNVASPYPPTKDIAVALDIDPAALATYNADASHLTFEAFPDSTFKFTTKTGTIRAGSRLDTFYVIFSSRKVNPTKSYMLPISIKTATGATVSGNLSTIYFHVVGNPLAGSYRWDFTRWNNSDSVGPNSGTFTAKPTAFIPNSPTNVEVKTGYFTAPRYELTFVNTGGVLSNFTLTFNADDIKYMNDNGVTIGTGPNILIADPINKIFKFQYTAVTTSGPRYVIDMYYP